MSANVQHHDSASLGDEAAGENSLCPDVLFFDSATRITHVRGAFCAQAITRADQYHVIPGLMGTSIAAATAKPLGVALYAGNLLGQSVIIAGARPIDLLVAPAARQAVVTQIKIFDIASNPPTIVEDIGVDGLLRMGDGETLQRFETDKGYSDAAFYATGVVTHLAALRRVTRPSGIIVQIGMLQSGDVRLPVNLPMAKEVDYRGALRFHDEYTMAVQFLFLVLGVIDASPSITDAAFKAAAD